MSEQRLEILNKLRDGEISADEAEKLLSELGTETYDADLDDHKVVILPKGEDKGITKDANIPQFENFWQWITIAGASIFVVLGAIMMSAASFFALLCLGPFVLAGFGVAAMGLWSKSSHWIHVRVQEKNGDKISISLPFPIGMASTIVQFIQPWINTQTDDVDLSQFNFAEMIEMMGDELSPENPIMVAVDDDEDQVLVYIT